MPWLVMSSVNVARILSARMDQKHRQGKLVTLVFDRRNVNVKPKKSDHLDCGLRYTQLWQIAVTSDGRNAGRTVYTAAPTHTF